jgi:hypothetical protein
MAYCHDLRQVRQLRKHKGGPPSCLAVKTSPSTTERKLSDRTGSSRGARNSSIEATKLRLKRSNLRSWGTTAQGDTTQPPTTETHASPRKQLTRTPCTQHEQT